MVSVKLVASVVPAVGSSGVGVAVATESVAAIEFVVVTAFGVVVVVVAGTC